MNTEEQNTESGFFTMMSHEFRTSLNTILMAVELLESEKCVSCTEQHETYLELMREAAEIMSYQLNKSAFNFPSN